MQVIIRKYRPTAGLSSDKASLNKLTSGTTPKARASRVKGPKARAGARRAAKARPKLLILAVATVWVSPLTAAGAGRPAIKPVAGSYWGAFLGSSYHRGEVTNTN